MNTDPYANKDLSGVPFINQRERFGVGKKISTPKIDMLISKIVGKSVYMSDPKLIQLIVKWKKNRPQDSEIPDNFLQNPNFIKELKETFK
jgi:hypothetical protein